MSTLIKFLLGPTVFSWSFPSSIFTTAGKTSFGVGLGFFGVLGSHPISYYVFNKKLILFNFSFYSFYQRSGTEVS